MVTDYFFVYSYFFLSWTMKFQIIKNFWKIEKIGNRRKINISHLWIFINLDILCWRSFQLVKGIFAMVPPFLVDWYWSQNLVWTLTCATYNKLSHKTCENAHQANNLANIPHFSFTNDKSMYVDYILRLIIISSYYVS